MLRKSLATHVQCDPMFLSENTPTLKLKNPVLKTKELDDVLTYHQHLYECLNTLLLAFIKITKLQNGHQKNPHREY